MDKKLVKQYKDLVTKLTNKLPMDLLIDDILDDSIILKLPMGLIEEIDSDNPKALLKLPNVLSESTIKELVDTLSSYTNERINEIIEEQKKWDAEAKERSALAKREVEERKRHIAPKNTSFETAIDKWTKLLHDYAPNDIHQFMSISKVDTPNTIVTKLEFNITLFKDLYTVSQLIENKILDIKNLIHYHNSKITIVNNLNPKYRGMCVLFPNGTNTKVALNEDLTLQPDTINLIPLDIYLSKTQPIIEVVLDLHVEHVCQLASIDGIGYLMVSELGSTIKLDRGSNLCTLSYI